MMECIEACEALDASDPSRAGADAGASTTNGPLASECPEPPFPCERMCWELDARFGRGRPTTQTAIDRTDDTDLAAIGEPYMRCAQARAAQCRAGTSTTPGATPSDAAGPSSLAMSWTGLFLECAGLPLDVALFD
ncbi:MAG TPA: hypothetical protein VMG12_05555 [Polyangiaceae bacterium]|nr:hypothetical protein [Polyangiaceae bacterium]